MTSRTSGRQVLTPDRRYIVVKGRLWRTTNPDLSQTEKERLVNELMDARRAVKAAKNERCLLREARAKVNAAKVALGERGEVWWTDGSPDLNRKMVENTPYREWFLSASGKQ